MRPIRNLEAALQEFGAGNLHRLRHRVSFKLDESTNSEPGAVATGSRLREVTLDEKRNWSLHLARHDPVATAPGSEFVDPPWPTTAALMWKDAREATVEATSPRLRTT